MTNHNMYGWIFTKNTYTGKWMAAKREYINELYNNNESKHVLKSSSINTLEYLINKTDGNPIKLKKLVK